MTHNFDSFVENGDRRYSVLCQNDLLIKYRLLLLLLLLLLSRTTLQFPKLSWYDFTRIQSVINDQFILVILYFCF